MPHVRLIHSVASDSALRELERHRELARPGLRILSRSTSPASPARPASPPASSTRSSRARRSRRRSDDDAAAGDGRREDSRRWFAALRELADERGLEHLSMGTSQDYLVAVEEGATIVRIGTRLYD